MVNTMTKLPLIATGVNRSFPCSVAGELPRRRPYDTLGKKLGDAHGREAAATAAGPDADQGRRKGAAGSLQQFGDAPAQSRGIYAEFCLHFPEWRAGQAAQQH